MNNIYESIMQGLSEALEYEKGGQTARAEMVSTVPKKKSILGAGLGLAESPSMEELEKLDEDFLADFDI